MKIKKVLQHIFSIRNLKKHKQILLFGIKLKIKKKKPLTHLATSRYTTHINLSYAENRAIGRNLRYDYEYSQETSSQLLYYIINQLKEKELKLKVQKNKKVKVGFFCDSLSKFPTNNIYHLMKKTTLFEPFVLLGCASEYDINIDTVWNNHQQEFEKLKNQGYIAYSLYDENRNFISIENFKPDILFVHAPYLEYETYMLLSNIYLNVNYLVCYVSYGYNISNSYSYHYNNRRINSAWKNFVATREDYRELMLYSKSCGVNAVLTGYPKLDAYSKPFEQCKIPQKLDNGNPIVIYAPHWTIVHNHEPNDLGTFDIYYKYFLNLAKKYTNINWCIKPHPGLADNLAHHNIMSYNDYSDYLNEINNLPNGYCEIGGEYIDLFRKSSLMIMDSASFIAEYLPSGNPCIFLVKPSRNQETYMDGFSFLGRKILSKYYLVHNKEELTKYFHMIMIDKQDPLKEERMKLQSELFINLGTSGETIVKYITNLLVDDGE